MSGETFTRIESERLILRRFGDSDLASFVAYRNDPEVARYQSWESCGEREAKEFFAELDSIEPGAPGEWFQFAVEVKETGALAGDCAMRVESEDPCQAEIGFTFSRGHQGRGYAAEAVSRLLDLAFFEMRLHRVVAITDQRNLPSARLLESVGFRREGCFVESFRLKGEWTSEYLYAVLADEWARKRR